MYYSDHPGHTYVHLKVLLLSMFLHDPQYNIYEKKASAELKGIIIDMKIEAPQSTQKYMKNSITLA